MYPKVLLVETGYSPAAYDNNNWWSEVLDYHLYDAVPRWWRRVEESVQLDLALAFRAKKIAEQFDIIWAGSEKVGIPLSMMRINRPIITVGHHMASSRKKRLLRLMGVTRKWAGMGYFSHADKQFMISYYGMPSGQLLNCMSAPIERFKTTEVRSEGPIISLGVSKRDYKTLIDALKELPGYETNIYVSSRYGDQYKGVTSYEVPKWVHFVKPVSDEDLIDRYQQARFVVLPLIDTTQFGAGASVAVEAASAGKAVIATKTQGISTYVIDGVTGILVPPHDRAALRDAIHKLWSQPELAHQMGVAGRKYIEAEFNPLIVDNNIKKFLAEVYEKSQQPH